MSLTVGGARSTQLYVPASYDAATPMPLVVLLHGYTASGAVQETYLQLQKQADAQGFLYVHPDGTLDASKNRFWNATDACCDFQGTDVDDEGYLMGLVDEIESKVSVDKKRVFFFGHSNGGFMAYRMACNHADRIAGVGVLAGAMVKDATACKPTAPVSVLHVHGTADATIAYKGGTVALGVPGYPGAEASVAQWVAHDACAPQGIASGTADYESKLPGEETSFTSYGGCQAGAAVELWTLDKGGHIPAFTKEFAPAAMKWLLSHPKP